MALIQPGTASFRIINTDKMIRVVIIRFIDPCKNNFSVLSWGI